jgi:hypothetical protein
MAHNLASPFALVTSPRLGLRHLILEDNHKIYDILFLEHMEDKMDNQIQGRVDMGFPMVNSYSHMP